MLSCPCVSDHGLKNWWRGGLWVCNKHVTFLMKNVLLLGLLQVVQHWLLKIEDQKFLKVSTLCRLGPFWLIRAKELRAGSLCPSLSQPWGGRSHLIWMPRSPGPDQMAEGKRHRSDMKRLQGCCWWEKRESKPFFFIILTLMTLKSVSVCPYRDWVFATSLWKTLHGVYLMKYMQNVVQH